MLRLVELDKRFGSTHAVRGASLDIEPGRIHAVVGENGAGKSTLLKMAAGLLVPDSGLVSVKGERLAPHTAAQAIARGVGMVQQHFALIGVFSGLENVVLGVEPTRGLGRLDLAEARARVEAILTELGASLPLDVPVETLGVGDRQRLEITRTLYRDARILILDEPTAVLTPGEAEALYLTLRRLADHGRAIVVVTHKLDEVSDHADLVTVMRKGRVVLTRELDELKDRDDEIREIAEAIMGGGVPEAVPHETRARKEAAIVVQDVKLGRALNGLTFQVRAGEIVGIAGVEGNGQRELVDVLSGQEPDEGTLRVVARPLVGAASGPLAIVHEDRQKEGLVLDATVRDNVLLGELGRYARAFGVLDRRAIERDARERVERAHATAGLDTPVRALSGGNQQKLVIARAVAKIALGASALVLAHPTRGVDIGASRTIYREILAAAEKQVAVLIISADLAELRAVCDRILVMTRGRIVAELPPTASDQEIGRAMLGAAP